MTPRHLAMGAALVLAAGLVVFGDNRPEPDVAEAVERAPAPPPSLSASAPAEPAIAALIPRDILIGDSAEAIGAPGKLFGQHNWAPEPAPQQQMAAAAAAPPPPTAPPLPFKLIGKAFSEGQWEVYLAAAGKIHIAKNAMVINGAYRVDAITPPTLTFTYLPLNQVQQLNIGVLD